MADDFRPHLLITEHDVEPHENIKQARSKDLGLDRMEHGTKLSSGLQEIVSAYTRVQETDSLRDEDIRMFEVVLQEGEKFSNKTLREFLEQEGMTIASVRDSRHAIVSSPKAKFDSLQQRVGNYRDNERSNKKFQYIDSFHFPDPIEKQAPSIKEMLEKEAAFPLDVEIMEQLLPKGTDPQVQARAEERLISLIQQNQGVIQAKPYKLSDGTPIVRAEIPLGKLEKISGDTIVSHVTPTGFYATSPMYAVPAQKQMALNPNVSIDELPIVAVLDTGVDFPAELEPLIVEHWVPPGAAPGDKKHGTNVASKVAFENLGEQLASGVLTPRARIIDCNIRGLDPDSKKTDRPDLICNSTMIARIKEAVLRYKNITKIFNFSSSEESPIQGDEISILGYELDVLAVQYGVKFTISAGNHYLYRSQDSLEGILQDDDNRIAAPADSMLNIAVGAIVGAEHKEGLSRQYDVAPYSRIGPGFRGFRKPDIVSYAGTMTKTDFVPPDDYAMMIASGGQWAFEAGTSFTAPTVAGDLAEISQSVPDQDILMSEALLYHGAEMPIREVTKKKITRDDNAFYGNLYGRGIANPLVSMFSTAHRVTFLHRGTMNKKFKQHAKFLMPGVCDTQFDMSKHDKKIRVTVTCVTQPPVDRTKGAEYLGAYVNASLHSRNGNDKLITNNPSESDGRKDWDTCFHFEKEFSSFHGGDWEVWLELHTRYDVEDDHEIDYALAITIEDLTKSLQLYDAIVNEAQNRFPAVQLVRLPVRT